MAHHVYNTRAFVLGSRERGEADKVLFLLTPDLGLVAGTVRGIRKANSRLRGILLDLSLVEVSLVRGKNAWRVTTASLIVDNAEALRDNKPALKALAHVALLLERLIHGEEKHLDLFAELENSTKSLLESSLDTRGVEAWEIMTVSRVLYHLGYLTKENIPTSSEAALDDKRRFVEAINMGLRESGLG